jgi:hypothetical protein
MTPPKKKNKRRERILDRAGVEAFNEPVETPDHPRFTHKVLARRKGQIKLIRFGKRVKRQQNDDVNRMDAVFWENKLNSL